MDYKVEILDSTRQPITQLKNLIRIDRQGNVLKYAKRLSDTGWAKFRLHIKDPIFSDHGNIVEPLSYGVRITRNNLNVWEGIITQNPHRRQDYIDVVAKGYLFRTKKVHVNRDAEENPGDGKDNYRTFKSGTMADAVTATFNEMKAKVGPSDIVKSFTLGTVENPDFPESFTRLSGAPLVGGWTFSDELAVQVDYKSTFYLWSLFGMYANCDFEVTNDLVFNFKKMIGTRRPELVFEWSKYGAVMDFDAPLDGENLVNDLMGIASDPRGVVLHVERRDDESVKRYQLSQDVMAFLDAKDKNTMRTRLIEHLRFSAYPDSVVNFVMNEKAYPLGQYDLGDTAMFKIKRGIIDVNQERRITGLNVAVHNTGTETIVLETNKPREDQQV